jgi:predicted lipoprotein with Yx(FWY)xxD motif
MTANNSRFGSLLVDAQGATLYTLTNNGQAVPCTSTACIATWPPLLLPSNVTKATGAPNLSTITASGGKLVTHDGLPLYRYAGDAAPGDANGDGQVSFGGVWHVVKTSGSTASTAQPPMQTPAAPSGSNPYGY